MRILVTGATGFIGMNLMPKLMPLSNVKLLTLNRNVDKVAEMYAVQPNVTHVSYDDKKQILEFSPNIIFHLAGMSSSADSPEIAEKLVASNITLGVQLLSLLQNCSSMKLFVNVGSFAEYMNGADHIEDAYLYAATKTAFRSFLDYYSSACGFKYIHAVPYTVYGGTPTIKRIMDYMIESIDAKEPVKMTAGEQKLDFIHVDDICRFFLYVVHQYDAMLNVANGYTFHLGTGKTTTLRQVAQIISHQTNKQLNINWGALKYRPRDIMLTCAPDCHLSWFQWHPQITIEQGISLFLQSLANK